ncbi:MAG: MnhB domain-containing protein [Thermodesulfobacteriota bacterium]
MTQHSPILRVIARYAVPLSVLVALRIFLQGHDEPGGGFIAGVLLAAAGAMAMMAFGVRLLGRVSWWRVAVVGLLVSILNGTVPLVRGRPFMDNAVLHLGSYHLPTATFFDLGVMLIVVGTLMTIFVELDAERR